MLIAIPFGIGTAVFLSEIAPRWLREILKPLVEMLGGLPSVVLGFLGILVLAPFLRIFLNLPTGLTALAGALLLGGIAVPTIVSIAEDALDAVPQSYREGALAAGRHQVADHLARDPAGCHVRRADRRHARHRPHDRRDHGGDDGHRQCPGAWPLKLSSIFSPVRTMTATIAAEMGEVANGSTHYHVLFFIGMVLFLISLVVNIIASSVVFRSKKRAERVLS